VFPQRGSLPASVYYPVQVKLSDWGYMNSKIIYRNYDDSYAEAVAEMWKQSRPGWPAGFFGPAEVTVAFVMQDERVSGKLFTELAFRGVRVL